jgi:hypothetical protein
MQFGRFQDRRCLAVERSDSKGGDPHQIEEGGGVKNGKDITIAVLDLYVNNRPVYNVLTICSNIQAINDAVDNHVINEIIYDDPK